MCKRQSHCSQLRRRTASLRFLQLCRVFLNFILFLLKGTTIQTLNVPQRSLLVKAWTPERWYGGRVIWACKRWNLLLGVQVIGDMPLKGTMRPPCPPLSLLFPDPDMRTLALPCAFTKICSLTTGNTTSKTAIPKKPFLFITSWSGSFVVVTESWSAQNVLKCLLSKCINVQRKKKAVSLLLSYPEINHHLYLEVFPLSFFPYIFF